MSTMHWKGCFLPMVLMVVVMLPLTVVSAMNPECPTTTFTPCAEEDGICQIPKHVRSGYFSIGCRGRFILTPFTNDDQIDVLAKCDWKSFGDVIGGVRNYCCYLKTEIIGLPRNGYQLFSYEHSTENEKYRVPPGSTIRFGSGSRWIYSASPSQQIVPCHYLEYGHWISGQSKRCEATQQIPSSLQADQTWHTCTGGFCTLTPGKVHWVRHMDLKTPEDLGNARLVLTTAGTDGKVRCHYKALGDPSPGKTKFCSISEPLILFGGSVGRWVKIQSCGGGCEQSISFSVGVTRTTAEELTTHWEVSFTAEVSSDLVFGETTLSTTVSSGVAKTLSTSLKVSETITQQFKCNRAAIYQFVVDSTQSSILEEKSFQVQTYDIFCVDKDPPQCPPGFCEDLVDCQTCTQPLGMRYPQKVVNLAASDSKEEL